MFSWFENDEIEKKWSKNSGDSSVIGEIPTSLGFFTQSSLIFALLSAKELLTEIKMHQFLQNTDFTLED